MKAAWTSSCSGFEARDVLLALLGLEGSSIAFALAGGVDAALDADPLDELGKPKPAETTPIEPTIELSSTTISSPASGDHVAAGGGDVLDGDDDLLALLLGERADALEDEMRLDGGAAGRIDEDAPRPAPP